MGNILRKCFVLAAGVALVMTQAVPVRAATIPTMVHCGQTITTSILVANSLFGCVGNGLNVGAPGITIDLGHHRIDGDGTGNDFGVADLGLSGVKVLNGAVSRFDVGVEMRGPAEKTVVEGISAHDNTEAGIRFSGGGHTASGNTARKNGSYGIYLNASSTNTISNNTVSQNGSFGIYVSSSDSNTVKNNVASGNASTGIYVKSSKDNTLTGNEASGGLYGIYLDTSNTNTLKGNTASDNTANGAYGLGIDLGFSNGNIIQGNTVSGNPADGILVGSSNTNTFKGNSITGNGNYGIDVGSSSTETITGNTVSDNDYDGIRLTNSDADTVSNNTANQNGFVNGLGDHIGDGVRIGTGVTNLTASKNKASGNDETIQCSPAANCV